MKNNIHTIINSKSNQELIDLTSSASEIFLQIPGLSLIKPIISFASEVLILKIQRWLRNLLNDENCENLTNEEIGDRIKEKINNCPVTKDVICNTYLSIISSPCSLESLVPIAMLSKDYINNKKHIDYFYKSMIRFLLEIDSDDLLIILNFLKEVTKVINLKKLKKDEIGIAIMVNSSGIKKNTGNFLGDKLNFTGYYCYEHNYGNSIMYAPPDFKFDYTHLPKIFNLLKVNGLGFDVVSGARPSQYSIVLDYKIINKMIEYLSSTL